MLKLQKITKKWIARAFIIIVAALVLIETLVIVITQESCYSTAKQQVKTNAAILSNTLTTYSLDTDANFTERIRELVENFSDKNIMELVAIDRNKKPVMSSSGFDPLGIGEQADITQALNSDGKMGESIEKIGGENVYCVTVLAPAQSGDILALRLMASLEPADKLIWRLSIVYVAIGFAVLLFILMTNMWFLHSILKPVGEVGSIAKKIASGNFDVRIENKYNDEMGDLCDIVNYMADELEQSETIKNEFISSVSHELRTPLTAIRGWGETLNSDDNLDKEIRRKGLNVIINETERLSGVVEDLLDFSKIQNGRFTIKKEKMDILAELEEAIIVFSERANREGISLEYNEPENLSPILGDKNRIRQVFVNLLDNSIKYSESGGEISVNAREEYGIIYITISDKGCGISAEDLPKIKKKFYKSNHTKRGSGIGLAVVDEIVSALGGTFEIKSQLGVGTTVTVSFPIFSEGEKENLL